MFPQCELAASKDLTLWFSLLASSLKILCICNVLKVNFELRKLTFSLLVSQDCGNTIRCTSYQTGDLITPKWEFLLNVPQNSLCSLLNFIQ